MILGIFGAGCVGKSVYEIASAQGAWEELLFIDDRQTGPVKGARVLAWDAFRAAFDAGSAEICVALGEPTARETVALRVREAGFPLANVVHPAAYIDPTARFGGGIVVRGGAWIGADVRIGENVHIGNNAIVAHDAELGANCYVNGNTFLGGFTAVGDGVYIGGGASVTDHILVGHGARISLGAAVFASVPAGATAIGNPAAITQGNAEGLVHAGRQKPYRDVFLECFPAAASDPEGFSYGDEGWDSVGHLLFVSALEENYRVRLGPDEIMRIRDYGSGKQVMRECLDLC